MPEIRLEVVDRGGWRQVVTLSKALSYIGSDPRCDLVLDSTRGRGVAPRHLQVIAAGAGLRVVNVGEPITLTTRAGQRVLAARAHQAVGEGDQLRLGEFTLIVAGGVTTAAGAPSGYTAAGAGAGSANGSANSAAVNLPVNGARPSGRGIGLELRFPDTSLTPERPLEGALVIQNLGDQAGAQFRIAIQDLSPECYELGSAPILFPGAQKEVFLRLRHPRSPSLLAGRRRFRVTVTAPEAYPGEAAADAVTVVVQPYYAHRVSVTVLD